MTDPVTLLLGDCLEVMPTLEAESVDAVVTDPPYGLEFMGKEWDSYKNNAFQSWCEQWGREALRVTKPGGYLLAFGGTRTHHRLVCALEDAGWIIRDELDWIYASGFPKGKANLKPAHEPIVLARKPGPLRPLGIDECRIGYQSEADYEAAATLQELRKGHPGGSPVLGMTAPPPESTQNTAGRWPSNVLLSDPELFDEPNTYVVGSGAVTTTSQPGTTAKVPKFDGEVYNESTTPQIEWGYGDSGGYSRFFIIPKADRAERERGLVGVDGKRGNTHPTVKSLDLMRHLVRLVTPPGGVVLDPFLGSGTTALAASEEGFSCIGIEREAEYLEIARGRLAATKIGMGL